MNRLSGVRHPRGSHGTRLAHRWRVAVTRDEGPHGPLAAALAGAGLEPVPCRAVWTAPPEDPEPLARAAGELERRDWLVASSARAVAAIVDARGGAPLPASLRTAAVGASTAAALRAAGAQLVLAGATAGADALVVTLRAADRWPGRSVLLPRAAGGRVELGGALRAWGAEVFDVVAYRTLPCAPETIVAAWNSVHPDAAVIASPSAARALASALGADTLRALAAVIAIGPTTARALADLGVDAEASDAADFAAVARRTKRALGAGKEH